MNHVSMTNTNSSDNVTRLGQVIESFHGVASRVETYYHHLEERIRELNLELNCKNEMLETNLREKEEVKNYLHNILESLNIAVVVVDLYGRITTFNRAAEAITGLTAAQVKGREFDKVFAHSLFHDYRLDFRHLKALQQHIDIETEVHHCCKHIVHVNLSIAALKNSQGDKTGIVVTMQDISQIKRLEERANRSDRLAAMGEMAGKIAHEVRNPLGSIELFASILRKELEGQGDLKMFAEHISTGTKSINNIISNLLLFIRPQQKPKFHAIDIGGPLNDSLFFSNYLIKSTDSIEITTQFHPEPLVVNGDLELLKQLFLNLILNAVQAMPNGGALTISTKQGKTLSKASETVEIRIADTGTGISSLDLHRVFDPFFTTKERGTGLGLAIVHNIVLIHGGTIDIESVEGKGTQCVVMLPLHGRARRKKRE